MRNSSQLQRQWWPLYNRLSLSSSSTQTASTSGTSSSSSSSAATSSCSYIGSLSNNKVFPIRRFSACGHTRSISQQQHLNTGNLVLCSSGSAGKDLADSVQCQTSNAETTQALLQPATNNLAYSVSAISTLVNVCLYPQPVLLFRRSSLPSLPFVLSKRSYSDEAVPSSAAVAAAPHQQHVKRRPRGSKQRLLCRVNKKSTYNNRRSECSRSSSQSTIRIPYLSRCSPSSIVRKPDSNNSNNNKGSSSRHHSNSVSNRFSTKGKSSNRSLSKSSSITAKKRKNGKATTKPDFSVVNPLLPSPELVSGFSTGGSSQLRGNHDFKFSSSAENKNSGASSVFTETSHSVKSLKPSEIVEFLNQHIIGQLEAKKAVANALRNRWRRQQLRNAELRDDIAPKNILMIGPTGVGKTEIARRMAKIIDAPFIKVEATKYTEVGFHGRDVDTIIKDLVELAVRHQYVRLETELYPQAQRVADEKILQALTGQLTIEADVEMYENLRLGRFDPQLVSVEVPPYQQPSMGMPGSNGGNGGIFSSSDFSDTASSSTSDSSPFSQNSQNLSFSRLWTPSAGAAGATGNGSAWRSAPFGASRSARERSEKRTMSVKEARAALAGVEFTRMIGLITKARITQQALEAVEQEGIVFLDEIDKICSTKSHAYGGPDASAEGVQRDLLPLIEGTTITTRYGNVKTDHILFIASGAFHSVKPSDMMAELQGRLPVRVELKPLTEEDFRKILTETRHNLIEQNIALLSTEGVTLLFEPGAADEIARVAFQVNSFVENIGARRLVTIIEKIMEEISFVAPEMENGSLVRVTSGVVHRAVAPMKEKTDLHKFIL